MPGNLVGPTAGVAITVKRYAAAARNASHVYDKGAATDLSVIGDLLPFRDEREIDFPSGFRREGARVLHVFDGTVLRTVSSVGQKAADEIEFADDVSGSTLLLKVVERRRHDDFATHLTRVNHVRYVCAMPEKDTEVGS